MVNDKELLLLWAKNSSNNVYLMVNYILPFYSDYFGRNNQDKDSILILLDSAKHNKSEQTK